MNRILEMLSKVSAGGVVLAALSCAVCFPALGVLAAALGLGFLSQFEGVAISLLLPLFAVIALLINGYGWFRNRIHLRGALSIIGPVIVLFTLYFLWHFSWSITLFYTALILMMLVSVADFIWPVRKRCTLSGASK